MAEISQSVPTAALARWHTASGRLRQVVCLGDSITYDRAMIAARIRRNWVEQLTDAFDATSGSRPGDGFRGLWRDEWTLHGKWTQFEVNDPHDFAPFRQGFTSSGEPGDVARWKKPTAMRVSAFDVYYVDLPATSPLEYRVDDGPWCNGGSDRTGADALAAHGLRRYRVAQEVRAHVDVRGASIVGIGTHASSSPAREGTVVHNLGCQHLFLEVFCRESAGDPLALLDMLRPDLMIVLFSNDVRYKDPPRFRQAFGRLLDRVQPYADVLLVAPYEQRPPPEHLTSDDPIVTRSALTTSGSPVVTTDKNVFAGSDIGALVAGTNIPPGARIASLTSFREATMTVPATGSADRGELIIGRGRDIALQAEYRAVTRRVARERGCAFLDLYEAWADEFGTGWDAARSAGLLSDPLHPSQRGHDDIASRVHAVLA